MAGITPTPSDKQLLSKKKFKDSYVSSSAHKLFAAYKNNKPLIFPLEFFSIKGLQPITIIYALKNNGFILFKEDGITPIIYGEIPGYQTVGPRTVNVEKNENEKFVENSQKTLPARILEEFPAEEGIIATLKDQKLLNTATIKPEDIATYYAQAEPVAAKELLNALANIPKKDSYINENLFNMAFTGPESNRLREKKAQLLINSKITPSAETIKNLLAEQSENSTLGALLLQQAPPEVQAKVAKDEVLLQTLLTNTVENPHNLNIVLAHTPPAQRTAILTADVLKEALNSKNTAVSATLFEYAQPETQQKLLQELPDLKKNPALADKVHALTQIYTTTLLTHLATNLAIINFIAF